MLEHKPRGMDDPDYARIFTQARVIAWQFGFALMAHGSYTRDLDLLMVPWEDRATDEVVPNVINRIAQVTGTTITGDPGAKPHGRTAFTLKLPDNVRFVDFSVMPCRDRIQRGDAPDARLQLLADRIKREGLEIFDGSETPQMVRDAIEWFASELSVSHLPRVWQHDETGRITETQTCPGPRWIEILRPPTLASDTSTR